MTGCAGLWIHWRVSRPTYERITFGRAESDPSAGKHLTGSVKQWSGDQSSVPAVRFRQVFWVHGWLESLSTRFRAVLDCDSFPAPYVLT